MKLLGCTVVLFLVEDGAVGTEEAVLEEFPPRAPGADVEHLALSLWVTVVPAHHLRHTFSSEILHQGSRGTR